MLNRYFPIGVFYASPFLGDYIGESYGTETIGEIFTTPKTMAYIMFVSAVCTKTYHVINDLVLYSVYVSLGPS